MLADRLPDGAQGVPHLRDVFGRMGFSGLSLPFPPQKVHLRSQSCLSSDVSLQIRRSLRFRVLMFWDDVTRIDQALTGPGSPTRPGSSLPKPHQPARPRELTNHPSTIDPFRFSNQYYRLLLTLPWKERVWDGPRQFEATAVGKELMMLPSDMALLDHPETKKWVEVYAKDKVGNPPFSLPAFDADFCSPF